jgi:photosystem II stability/assembly factor-like uncharacterized protein
MRRVSPLAWGCAACCCAVLATAACGGSGPSGANAGATAPTTTAATSTAATTTGTASSPPPAGGPVPSGFEPVSFTAVSADDFWLLGTAPCSNPVCTSIVRTTDGGAHFVGIPAPVAPLRTQAGGSGEIDTLRFADRLDGYAFGLAGFTPADGGSGAFFETHDGGAHWREASLGPLRAFGTGGGYVFAVTGACAKGTCAHLELRRSPVGEDAWTAKPLSVGGVDPLVSMTVHGSSVWLSLSVSGGTHPHQTLLESDDSGSTFTTLQSPCFTGLGGTLAASSTSVLWAVCPTGMLSGAFRSEDGGATWSALHPGKELANSAQIAPASDDVAVIATGDQAELLRTADGGDTFASVYPVSSGSWSFVGFTDAVTGSALRFVGGSGENQGERLYRSTDGGVDWRGPVEVR